MAPKKVQTSVKLQIEAGKATPAPPVGPALGQAQINIMEFCKQFNAKTSNKEMAGLIIPVVITVYTDQPCHLFVRRLGVDRKSTRLNSSHANISYAVFCLKKKK